MLYLKAEGYEEIVNAGIVTQKFEEDKFREVADMLNYLFDIGKYIYVFIYKICGNTFKDVDYSTYRICARILMIIKFIFEKASLIVVVC